MLQFTHIGKVDWIYIDLRTTPAQEIGSTTTTMSTPRTVIGTANGSRSWSADFFWQNDS
jgi:hypothetical protein